MRTETTDTNAKGRGARIAAKNTTTLTSPFVMHSTGKPDNELTSDDDTEEGSPPPDVASDAAVPANPARVQPPRSRSARKTSSPIT